MRTKLLIIMIVCANLMSCFSFSSETKKQIEEAVNTSSSYITMSNNLSPSISKYLLENGTCPVKFNELPSTNRIQNYKDSVQLFQRNDSCFAHVIHSVDSVAIVVFKNDSSVSTGLYSLPNTENKQFFEKRQKAKEQLILERQKNN